MRNHFKKQAMPIRKEMKSDLRKIMNLQLAMLIMHIYISHRQRNLLHEIWYVLGTRYHDIYRNEFCGKGGLVGKMLCGRFDELLNQMYFIDRNFYEKYHGKITNSNALGDAYAVALAYIKNNKEVNR